MVYVRARPSRIARLVLPAALSLGGGRVAAAQTEPAPSLTWRAPSGCPSEADVEGEVHQALAGSDAELAPFEAVVEARGPAGGRWRATLQFAMGETRAERRFEAESCQAIASAVALVVALWAEREAAPPPAESTPAPLESPPSKAAPVPAIAARPALDREAPGSLPAARTRFVFMANALLDRNTLPDAPAVGVEVLGGPIWGGPSWRLRALAGLSFFPSARSSSELGMPAGEFWLLDASGRGCFTLVGGPFEIGPCAGAALSVMGGTAIAYGSFQYPEQVWLSLMGSGAIAWRISPTSAVFARGEVVVPNTRRSWNVPSGGGVTEGYKVPAVAGRGALGIELRFQ